MSALRLGCAAVILFTIAGGSGTGHDIITTNLTYTRDISRIFAQRCVACHAEGSSIPLTSYEETRPWAVAIKEQVLGRTMPPFGAVKGFGNLMPDGGLSQEEIMIISGWVIGGAPNGDPKLLAKPISVQSARQQAAVTDGPKVSGRFVLPDALRVTGIRPLTDAVVASARITAVLPDGRVEPLLWLFRYDPKFGHSFTFRNQLSLPAKTVIQSTPAVSFVLETRAAATGSLRGW